ncbi:MAG TPA: glycosyltransferase [Solirubrobacterales bacterium]|nr:glycosyltransferase [Solirubrobacterales bacterium]
MIRLLFTLWDGGGNSPPVLSLAGALVERGHDIRVLADPSLREAVLGSGARHVPWTTAPHRATPDPETEFVRDFEARTPLGAMARIRDRLIVGAAPAFARDTLAEIRRDPVDGVISENLLLGSQVAAVDAGVANISLVPNIYPGEVAGVPPFGLGLQPRAGRLGQARDRLAKAIGSRLWDKRLADMNRLLGEHGQPPASTLFELLDRPDRVLVLTSAAFEHGGGARAPANVRYCGPRLDDPDWAGDWSEPEGDDPLVLVALSTTTQDQDPMIRRVVRALGRMDVRGLVTTGPSFAADGIDAPGNVTIVAAAPHSAVLPRAEAVVTHAGHGTVIKALAHGVPLLCMPVGRDQPDTAARVVASGAGLRLRPGAGAAAIARALGSVLGDRRFRAAAERMAAAIAADRERDLAVAEIEDAIAAPAIPSREPGRAGAPDARAR